MKHLGAKGVIFLLFFLLTLDDSALTESKIISSIPVLYLPQGHVITALSGYGYNPSTIVTTATIGCSNPAMLVDLKRSFGFSYQYNTKIKRAWYFDFEHRRIFNAIPQSVGLAFPFNSLHLGLAMNQVFNSKLDYGEVAVYMVSDNDQGYIETGRFYPYRTELVYQFSLAAAAYLNKSKSLSVGLQCKYNHLDFYQYLGYSVHQSESGDSLISTKNELTQNAPSGNFSIGIRYRTPREVFPRFQIGLYYESRVRFKHSFTYLSETINLAGDLPAKIHVGTYLETQNGFFFSQNLSYLFWGNACYSFHDQPEFAINVGYPLGKNLILSAGVFYTNYHRDSFIPLGNNPFKLIHLLFGGIYRFKDFSLEFTCADGHLFSGKYRKQTIFETGIGYTF